MCNVSVSLTYINTNSQVCHKGSYKKQLWILESATPQSESKKIIWIHHSKGQLSTRFFLYNHVFHKPLHYTLHQTLSKQLLRHLYLSIHISQTTTTRSFFIFLFQGGGCARWKEECVRANQPQQTMRRRARPSRPITQKEKIKTFLDERLDQGSDGAYEASQLLRGQVQRNNKQGNFNESLEIGKEGAIALLQVSQYRFYYYSKTPLP